MTENFVRLVEAVAERAPRHVALTWDGGSLDYGRLDRLAAGFARFLHTSGVRPGDRVAITIRNRWPLAAAVLGTLKLGATAAPVDPLLKDEERRAVLDDLRPRVVAHEVLGDETTWPTPAHVEAPALVLYTSGSTGVPKGAVLSHPALIAASHSWTGPVMSLTPDDVVLAVLPLTHSFGLNGALLAPLTAGAQIALVERFTPEAAVAAIRRHGVTVFPGVATMFRRILDSPVFSRESLATLRLAVSGAAPCAWSLADEWRQRTGARLLRGYGMTELFRPISYLAGDATDLPDAIGRPVPGVKVRIMDQDERDVPPGETGELWIETPAAMDGYLGAAAETRAVLADGWFRTGDLARLTLDGHVVIAGRKRERILRGGYSVFPQEVEAALCAHPAVAESAVIGEPHPDLGEEVVAYVVLRAGASATPEALIAHCRERLAGFKYPRRVIVADELPKSSAGKILKARLTAEPPLD